MVINSKRYMRVLMISTDRGLLSLESAVAVRHRDYGSLAGEIHIVLFSLRRTHSTKPLELAPNVHVYPTGSRFKWLYIYDAYRIGKRLMREKNITLISAQNPFETGIVAWLISRARVRVDFQLHTDPFTPYFVRGHGVMNRLRVRMAYFLLPKAGVIRVVSGRIQKHLARMLPQARVTLLPIFVDISHIEHYTPRYDLHKLYPQFKTIVLVLSRLEPEKNITLGIEALARALPAAPEAGLVIVGRGSHQGALERYAKERGVATHVVFHGWVEETSSAFKTADIFMLMSDFEGYAMTLIEAASAGTPIVTTDVGLVGDVLIDEESALVCAPRDAVCLARQLERLITSPSLRQRVAGHARQAVKERVLQDKQAYLKAYGAVWHD